MIEKVININWLNINYKEFWENSLEVFLILHGWWWNSDSWIKVWELIEKEWFKVIIPDLPWFWKTILEKVFILDNYAEIIESFVKKLWLNEVFLLWHSNGGAISIKIENRKIIKINKLILNNSAWIRNKKSTNLKRKILKIIIKPFKILTKLPFWEQIKILFYRFIWWQDYLNSLKNHFLKETYLNMIKTDLQSEIKNITTKTILIWWKFDTYTPLEDWIWMNKNISNSKLIIFEDQKHWIHFKAPQKLVKTIIKNLK
jgi:pimeloyl-ACP methyl ester carboxylesterase